MKKLLMFSLIVAFFVEAESPEITPVSPHVKGWHYAGHTDTDNIYIKNASYSLYEGVRSLIMQYRPRAAGGAPAYVQLSVKDANCGANSGMATITDFEGRDTFLPYYREDDSITSNLVNILCSKREAFEPLPEH